MYSIDLRIEFTFLSGASDSSRSLGFLRLGIVRVYAALVHINIANR